MTQSLVVLDSARIGEASTLHDLLSGDPAYPGAVRYLDPLGQPWPAGFVPSLRERAAAMADTLADPGAAPDGGLDCGLDRAPGGGPLSGPFCVVAHCTNTALACQLAGVLAQRGSGPRCVVAFAPEFVDERAVRSHVRDLMATLGADEQTAVTLAAETWPDALTDPGAAFTRTMAALRRAAAAQATQLGIEGDEADNFAALLTGQYELWLTHLASHVGAAAPDPHCPVLVVDLGAEEALATGRRIAPAAHLRGFGHARPNAFTEPALRALLIDLLQPVPSAGGASR